MINIHALDSSYIYWHVEAKLTTTFSYLTDGCTLLAYLYVKRIIATDFVKHCFCGQPKNCIHEEKTAKYSVIKGFCLNLKWTRIFVDELGNHSKFL